MLSVVAFVALLQGPFTLPRLEQYAPSEVDSVKFGITADKDLKKMFKVGKGAIRPEALVIGTDMQWRYDALLNGRGGDAKAIAIWAESKKPVEVSEIASDLGTGERYFARDRSSDWSVLAYPDRGIALYATREGSREFVEGVLLTDKDYVRQLIRTLDTRETQILNIQDIFDRKDRRVSLRSLNINFTRKNINFDENREERLMQSFAERRAESRNIRFGGGGDGTISITVSVDFEKTNVSVSLRGRNEVGEISGNGSASARKFRVQNDVAFYSREAVEDAVLEALDEALSSGENAIRNQRPPTETDERKRLIAFTINSAIK